MLHRHRHPGGPRRIIVRFESVSRIQWIYLRTVSFDGSGVYPVWFRSTNVARDWLGLCVRVPWLSPPLGGGRFMPDRPLGAVQQSLFLCIVSLVHLVGLTRSRPFVCMHGRANIILCLGEQSRFISRIFQERLHHFEWTFSLEVRLDRGLVSDYVR